MNRVVFAVIVLLSVTGVCRGEHTEDTEYYEQLRKDLIAQGATPEQLKLLETVYNTSRPTLVCLCHHEANVTTCGVDGHLYLNECSARCKHVKIACVGEKCGDCDQYGPDHHVPEKNATTAVPHESPSDETSDDKRKKEKNKGRRLLTA